MKPLVCGGGFLTRLVNAHTHLELTVLAGRLPPHLDFTSWIEALVEARRRLGSREISQGIARAIEDLKACGTVAIGDVTSTGLSVEPLLESGLSGIVFIEVLGREPSYATERLRNAQIRVNDWRRRENGMRIGLSVHSPYTSNPELLQAASRWCIAERVPLAVHAAESRAEVRYLRDGTGPLRELNERLLPGCRHYVPGLSPIAYLNSLGVLQARPLLIHGVEVDDDDLRQVWHTGCAVVHCPRSNMRLGCNRMPLERYLARGITVAIGTDSLASAPSLDVRDEIAAATSLHAQRISKEVLTDIATIGGLRALGLDQTAIF